VQDVDAPLGEIVNRISLNASALVREEIELAKAEMEIKFQRLVRGAIIGATAGFFVFLGLIFVFHTLAWGLNDVFGSLWLGFLITTGVLMLLAAILLVFSKGNSLFTPTYTLRLRAENVGGLKARSSVFISGVLWFLPIAILIFAVEYTLIVSYEEGVLESIFGREYLDYKLTTSRWFPRPPAKPESGPHDWGEAWRSEVSTFMQYIALVVVFALKQKFWR